MSDDADDVRVQVSVDGQVSDEFKITVRAPHTLIHNPTIEGVVRHDDTINGPGDVGYLSIIPYRILDQFGDVLPLDVAINEGWTSGVTPSYSGENWSRSNAGGLIVDPRIWADGISTSGSGLTPAVINPCSPTLCSIVVDYWDGEWRVGSTTPGLGVRVQTNRWRRYTDHGEHINIVSPVSSP
jgi:hypothetical protein